MQQKPMQMPLEEGKDRTQSTSGPAAKPGPKRVLDADATRDQRIVVDVSHDFHRRVKYAALIEGISMTELVLRVLSPEVDSILERNKS